MVFVFWLKAGFTYKRVWVNALIENNTTTRASSNFFIILYFWLKIYINILFKDRIFFIITVSLPPVVKTKRWLSSPPTYSPARCSSRKDGTYCRFGKGGNDVFLHLFTLSHIFLIILRAFWILNKFLYLKKIDQKN